jgi:hypothetical protein
MKKVKNGNNDLFIEITIPETGFSFTEMSS